MIDADAEGALRAHMIRLCGEAKVLRRLPDPAGGHFFAPALAEIPSAAFLQKEVFGPILHVVRYNPTDLDEEGSPLLATGYGLTLGVHSRIEAFAEHVQSLIPAGNTYVNRSMIGAVVEPSRAKKVNRPRERASPSANCAISVCAPDQANDTAAPFTSCSNNRPQNQGTSGKSGANTMLVQTKNSVTLRVPNRSISTPIWIDRNIATSERAPTRMPTSAASNPSDSVKSGIKKV